MSIYKEISDVHGEGVGGFPPPLHLGVWPRLLYPFEQFLILLWSSLDLRYYAY